MPIVLDGSALAELVLRSTRAAAVEELLGDEQLVAPDLVGAEVLSVVRGMLLRGLIDEGTAARAVANLAVAPVRRMTTEHLVDETWRLRRNATPYDATYLALARALDAPLITFDARMARAPVPGVRIVVP